MITLLNERDCCGCTACEQVCSKGAIKMKRDKKGFLRPVTNPVLCNNCGLCELTCPIIKHENDAPREPRHTYAVKNKDEQVRMSSSSGGVFSVLAKETIDRGGVVYGAVFNSQWRVVHARVDDAGSLEKLRGSKYVQSDLRGIYSQVRRDLLQGLPVLFSGTPCQVAALHSYLRKPYSTLTTVDFVCHGVPNPRIWEEYLAEAVSNSGNKNCGVSGIESISFRNKSHGWKKFSFSMSVGGENACTECTFAWEHTYMKLFLHDFICRPSCHHCRFRNGKSGADYTLGDYWAGERFYPEFFDNKGVSLLLAYSQGLPTEIKQETEFIETAFDHAKFGNPAITADWPENRYSRIFYICHDTFGMKIHSSLAVAESCMNTHRKVASLWGRALFRLKTLIKTVVEWQK